MVEGDPLEALVILAQRGDKVAFDSLVGATGDRCLAVAFRILRDLDRAEDAVQSAYIAAWRDLPSLRDPVRFEAWLHRLLVRACHDEARAGRRYAAVVRTLPMPDDGYRDDALTVNDRDQLERGLGRLSPDHRAVLVFHHYLGLSLPEVAERVGIPVGTAKSRLHYATDLLRAALEADARAPDVRQERSA